MIINQFEELEKKIEQLVERQKSLETMNTELTNRIHQLEDELKIKVESEQKNAEQRTIMKSKIDQLLLKLNQCSET
ncbi:MAG: hypothetical protein HQK77_11445 [Desulfobacterales bacterium]|nr:hypothetical protein [Desulfobacterales bacterium]